MTDERRKFAEGWVRKVIDQDFKSWGEKPLDNGDELHIAYTAGIARFLELLTNYAATALAFAALGLAVTTVTFSEQWLLVGFLVIAAAAVFVGLLACVHAGISAAAQAVTENRQSVKLALVVPAVPAALVVPAAAKATVAAGVVAAFAGGVLLTLAARRQRPKV